ncbi:hypothetical protein RHGRI_034114 [Rhododendron griersonianum]|uniref:No apical meristem-associated C-terminal domain-containing protein n=1 Tax=Rhododendron griersonianum TaxID=479676 RepID=A0AAV6HZS7_9ERIC|nr:hypothetical protein RHGRI_034114 [Rhododendron griersonianum]
MGSIPKKTPRGGNFTMEEDVFLVLAWLNTSMDPIQGDINVAMDNFVDVERPVGRKGEKERLKQTRHKLVEKKMEMLEKTYDQEEEKIRIKKERLEMDKFKDDERVMMMYLNGLLEEQQEFYTYRKMEILKKRRVK